MATIGTLAVNIVATTDKFIKGLSQSKSALGKFVQSVNAVQAAVGTLAAVGFASVVQAAIETGSELKSLTEKLDVSAEALSALHFAATQTQSSAEGLDRALAKMAMTIGKANEGNQAAIASFNRLGLSVSALAGQGREQQFLAIVDALNKLPTSADQAATASEVFGKGWLEIAPMIKSGTDAIVAQGKAAAETGAIISGDMATALNDAGDAIDRFTTSWNALKTQMVGAFAPGIAMAMDGIVSGLKVLKAWWWGTQVLILDGARAITLAVQALEKSFSWLPFVGDWLAKDANAADTLAEAFKKAADEKVASIQAMSASSGGNPLAKSTVNAAGYNMTSKDQSQSMKALAADKKAEEKATAENTKIIAEQMKLLNRNAKLGRATSQADLDAVRVKIAGVR